MHLAMDFRIPFVYKERANVERDTTLRMAYAKRVSVLQYIHMT